MVNKKQDILKKKKKWYSINAPNEFKNVVLGESYIENINSLKGRTLKVSLMNVTNDIKKQNINVGFIIDEIKGDYASTRLISYELMPSFVKRLAKKSKIKLEDSFKGVSKDKKEIIIKPMILTKNKINNSVAKLLRKTSREFVFNYLSERDSNEFGQAIVSNFLQKELEKKLNKITPIMMYAVRIFKISK